MKKVFILVFFFLSSPAFSYIGPGTGAGLIATVLGVLVAVLLALFGILYYPIKRLIKNLKSRSKK